LLNDYIQIKSDNFDGPLALLLLLIQKEEMKIRDLDLTKITQQYLGYLSKLEEVDFNVAGDYLYLASTLILLKSKDCLSEEDEKNIKELHGDSDLSITSQSELVRRLEELERIKYLSSRLMKIDQRGREVFTKPKVNKKAIVDSILTPVALSSLAEAMIEVISRNKRKFAIVKKDKISIKEKLSEFKSYLSEGDETLFKELLEKNNNGQKIDVIITFISILELARLGKISIFQNDDNSEIYVRVISSLDNFDVREADGFDEEEGSSEELLDCESYSDEHLTTDRTITEGSSNTLQ
jgi:segregation and condensation protein A